MKLPSCPDHDTLMLDLARGQLNDRDAGAADEVRESCRHCAEWWNITFSASATAQVDDAVAEAFAAFSAPARRRRSWLAAAAAAVVAVGVGTTTLLWDKGDTVSSGSGLSSSQSVALTAWDFEDSEQLPIEIVTHIEPTPEVPEDPDAAVFVSDLESGDLGFWVLHS